jgi:signal transduction histidine kinase
MQCPPPAVVEKDFMMRSHDEIARVTAELKLEMSLAEASHEPIYRSVPANSQPTPFTWRIRLSPTNGTHPPVYLELKKEVIIGRYDDSPNVIGLFAPEIADQLGISRRHMLLRPSENKLLIMDLGSTNGTFLNSTRLTPKLPYTLNNDDRLALGHLEMVFSIHGRPVGGENTINGMNNLTKNKQDAAALIPKIARTLTGIVDVGETLKTAQRLATFHTGVRHIMTWLLDEKTGEVHPVSSQDDRLGELSTREQRQLAKAAANFAPEVIRTGKPLLIKKDHSSEQVVAVAPLLDVLFAYPFKVGDMAIGAIAGVHSDPNAPFSDREERILEAIAEFSAISIHNGLQMARLRESLIRREKLLNASNYIIGHDVKRALRMVMNNTVMLNDEVNSPEAVESAANEILIASVQTSSVLDQLTEVVSLGQNPVLDQSVVDLRDIATSVLNEIHPFAHSRMSRIEAYVMGEPYLIQGDSNLIASSILKLLDNALRYSPPQSQVQISINFGSGEVLITIRDNGPGFPKADLPNLLDQYYRGAASVDDHTGLGLGLEYVRSAVEAHRGTFLVRNGEDRGAECIITLPGDRREFDELHDTLPRKKMIGVIST